MRKRFRPGCLPETSIFAPQSALAGTMRSTIWMKRTTQLNYGWVLVLFGVLIRLALWPLNQGAMRTSLKMQAIQPLLRDWAGR